MNQIRKTAELLAIFVCLAIPVACRTPLPAAGSVPDHAEVRVGVDPHSFSRPDEVSVRHLDLDLDVDFTARRIDGVVTLRLDNPGADELVLDTRDLTIHRVGIGEKNRPTGWRLGEAQPDLGRPLIIDIDPATTSVTVEYETSPDAGALQWLTPAQTASGKPFLFTQSQAILARTWVPCQDTPSVRMTYGAIVRVPEGMLAVMSAENPTEVVPDGIYHFRMPQPVPSYLLALAVGELEFRALGPRSGVYAEPQVIEAAAWELADTPAMIEAAERLYGPYRWSRYDLLVLPPSFPFGGMENPRLTFITPTILAKDRSLVSLIAHELAHSWSGNLVTNATWNDFWLNEGFTEYFTMRIMEEVYGREYSEMLTLLSMQGLEEEIEELGHDDPDTHLFLDLAGRDPDEGMTAVAYDKGHLFLRTIEEAVGRERFDHFLRDYFDKFAFQSMSTRSFLDYLQDELIRGDDALAERIRVDAWVYGPGLPENAPVVRSPAFEEVEHELGHFGEGVAAVELDARGWNTHQWLHFIRNLPEPLSYEQLAELDSAFDLTSSGNSEVLFAWLLQAIRNEYDPAWPAVERFLTSMGRRKFLEPLYSELAKTEKGLERARAIYRDARPSYHPLAQSTIDEVLGIGDKTQS